MDWSVIEQKLESLRRALNRVESRCPATVELLIRDFDAQDILALNLTRAVQLSVDIGSHLIASTDYPAPKTMGEVFDVLFNAQVISESIRDRMKKSVGFRNLAIHNYEAINWAIVHAIATRHLDDFKAFAQAIEVANQQGSNR